MIARPSRPARSLAALLLGLAVLAGPARPATTAAKTPEPEESIDLPKMQVKGAPICSFGIGIVGTRDRATRKVRRLYIADVIPDTPAARLGLKVNDEILSINGVKVTELDGSMKLGSPLFNLLVNQAAGQVITLEVVTRTVTTAVLTATPLFSVVSAPVIRIKTGVSSPLTDENAIVWRADTGFVDGETIERPGLAIASTPTPSLYRAERYGMTAFHWKLAKGKYTVRLHFAETHEEISGRGQRVFSFTVEGHEFKDFDVWKKAGGARRAYVESIEAEVLDGTLDITFRAQVGNPEINALEIIPRLTEGAKVWGIGKN
jgi:hypothetical protein